MSKRGRIVEKEDINNFLTDPQNAIFTLEKGDMHRTYMANKAPDDDAKIFIKLLTGSDNTDWHSYTYIGLLITVPYYKFIGKKTYNINANNDHVSLSFYMLNTLIADLLRKVDFENSQIHFYHEGKCSRCGRRLTDPDSIRKGMGSVCINKI